MEKSNQEGKRVYKDRHNMMGSEFTTFRWKQLVILVETKLFYTVWLKKLNSENRKSQAFHWSQHSVHTK